MPKVTVDGVELEVPQGATVLQACELAGKEIPRFCYHERLSIAGNCRMCLVEVAPGPPKPQASCALPAADGQAIRTDTAMVKKAREGVMEFLLINHPLDCPICDQGGECDLQDQAIAYGRSFSRYEENKRAIDDKYMGPVIKTSMTRCIQCTRCIRFSSEVAGVDEIGMLYRGEDSQITSYLEHAVGGELSGNLADVCPVGALLQKPQSFESRPWELRRVPGIDVMDAVGSNIRLDVRQRQVMRILPRINEDVNEEWISDKTRHHVDALVRNRLDRPWVREKGKLREASWTEALDIFAERLKQGGQQGRGDCRRPARRRDDVCGEEAARGAGIEPARGAADGACLRHQLAERGCVQLDHRRHRECRCRVAGRLEHPLGSAADRDPRPQGRAQGRQGLRDRARDRPRHEGRMARRRSEAARQAAQGGEGSVRCKAERPAVIVGGGALAAGAQGATLALVEPLRLIREGWNGYNVLHFSASRMAGMMLGYAQKGGLADIEAAAPDLVLLLGADEVAADRFKGAFKVYIGHHGDAGARQADLVLPGAAYAEKHGTYVNTEGRVQRGEKAVFPPGEAREDWSILRAVSELAGKKLPFDNFAQLRAKMVKEFPQLGRDGLVDLPWSPPKLKAKAEGPIRYPIADFFLTNAICRASPTMQRCSEELVRGVQFKEAAE